MYIYNMVKINVFVLGYNILAEAPAGSDHRMQPLPDCTAADLPMHQVLFATPALYKIRLHLFPPDGI